MLASNSCWLKIFSLSLFVVFFAQTNAYSEDEPKITVVAFGWDTFIDDNRRGKVPGPTNSTFDVSAWSLSEAWRPKFEAAISADDGPSFKPVEFDEERFLRTYKKEYRPRKAEWSGVSEQVRDLASRNGLDYVVLFAPTAREVSATTMFGEMTDIYPGGVGIRRYNRSYQFCFIAGDFFLFDGKTGQYLETIHLQQDFGFMRPRAFFIEIPKHLHPKTFGSYSAAEKAEIETMLKTGFDKHFNNSLKQVLKKLR